MIVRPSYPARATPTFGPNPCRTDRDSGAIIRLENIHKVYTRGAIDVPVLRGVSLSIAQREMVALMGVSGSGKNDADQPAGLPRSSDVRQAVVRSRTMSPVLVKRSEPGCGVERSASFFRTSTSCLG